MQRRAAQDEIELEPMMGAKDGVKQLVAIADVHTRNDFVRKVYGILGSQLLATMILAGTLVRYGRHLQSSNPSIVVAMVTLASLVSLMVSCVFACCPDAMRTSPKNYGLIALFTVAESVLVGFVCLQYTLGSVILCCGLTGVVVLGLTVYATKSGKDFTGAGPYLVCAMLVLFSFGLFMSIAGPLGLAGTAAWGGLQTLYAAGGALVFSFFIVYDTQLIVGGGHENEFCVDDYAMAAISLYIDVIQLFLAILRLVGSRDDNGL
jgi:FtsH-binding integral membrane protein